MQRMSDETRQRVQQVAQDDFGGVPADEAIRRLLDEHWELAAVHRTREQEPQEWADYLREAEEWFVDFDPVRGNERREDRPALVVSSALHLEPARGSLISALPLTSRERRGWLHRPRLSAAEGRVITEQVRTVSAQRFRRPAPELAPAAEELVTARRILGRVLDI